MFKNISGPLLQDVNGDNGFPMSNAAEITQGNILRVSKSKPKCTEWITYSRRRNKGGSVRKKGTYNCSNLNLRKTVSCSKRSSMVKSNLRRQQKNDAFFEDGFSPVDGKQSGLIREGTALSNVSTDSDPNMTKLSGFKRTVKQRSRRKKKKTTIVVNLPSTNKGETHRSRSSANTDSTNNFHLHSEITRGVDNVKETVAVEGNSSLQESTIASVARDSTLPPFPECPLQSSYLTYSRKMHKQQRSNHCTYSDVNLQVSKNGHHNGGSSVQSAVVMDFGGRYYNSNSTAVLTHADEKDGGCSPTKVQRSATCISSKGIKTFRRRNKSKRMQNSGHQSVISEKNVTGSTKSEIIVSMEMGYVVPELLSDKYETGNIKPISRKGGFNMGAFELCDASFMTLGRENKGLLGVTSIELNTDMQNDKACTYLCGKDVLSGDTLDEVSLNNKHEELCHPKGETSSEQNANMQNEGTCINLTVNGVLNDVMSDTVRLNTENEGFCHPQGETCILHVANTQNKETCRYSSAQDVLTHRTSDVTIKDGLPLYHVNFPMQRESISCRKRKLLVLDLNGLLVDVTYEHHAFQRAPMRVSGKSVYKRPFCEEFLEFCFERFDIGIWSSRKRKNIDAVVNFLFGEKRSQLLFCWDLSKCKTTGFNTLEDANKPLVLKELKKLWDKDDEDLPWEKGEYSSSNTLLIDDSPYKALSNPPHTAIFPCPYDHGNENDNALGVGGDLRIYLEGLAMADDVQSFVGGSPFGQRAIAPDNPYWGFYLQIIERLNLPFAPAAATVPGLS